MSKRDYYDVLGASRGASDGDLRKAYRQRAKELHPDRNASDPNAAERFKEVNEAYDVLKDPQKRAAYDQFGHAAFADGTAGAGAGAGRRGPSDFGSNFSDFFEDLFGEAFGGRRGGADRGSHLHYKLTIDLEDAYHGKTVTITAPRMSVCDVCNGVGSANGEQPVTCPTCSGRGKVRAQQGFFTVEVACMTCHGRGTIIKNPCRACGGAGRVEKQRSLSVPIPRGVEDGQKIRLSGEGEAGARGGPPGDIFITIRMRPHDMFSRDGADLLCQVTVPLTDAALGGAVEVPTLDGQRTKVSIPAGAQTGKQLRMRGRGMPSVRGSGVGDLFLEIVVETPQNLTARQKDLLRQFAAETSETQQPSTSTFRERAARFWSRDAAQR